MNTEEKVRSLELSLNILFDDNIINDIDSIKEVLRNKWEEAKKDEDLLAQAIKVTNRNEEKLATDIFSPTIASLILLDYKEVNPLIYEVLINIIYNSHIISCLTNSFTTPYNYTFLTSTLFNPNLSLDDEQLEFLFYQVLKDYELIDRSIRNLSSSDSRFDRAITQIDRSKSFKEIQTEVVKFVNYVHDKKNNPHFRNAPANIKYFILRHPVISKLAETDRWSSYFKKLFLSQEWNENFFYLDLLNKSYNCYKSEEKDDFDNYKIFLEDAEERIKVNRLIKMPF